VLSGSRALAEPALQFVAGDLSCVVEHGKVSMSGSILLAGNILYWHLGLYIGSIDNRRCPDVPLSYPEAHMLNIPQVIVG